jgi:glycoprotein endo-alpha-1,2-mannosidase
MMKKLFSILLFAIILVGCSCEKQTDEDPTPVHHPKLVTKTNPTKLYMHYMPWFHSKDFSGYWGSHWRMNNKNPEVILPNGNREIAAHYYPLIGPYDSADPDVIDYHLLLMKYAGIDGILIDWYGSFDVLDYGSNLENSNAIIQGINRVGLDFAIVYEEFTADEVERRTNNTAIEAAQADMSYMVDNYFNSDLYIEIDNEPLLLTFGPRFFTSKYQWNDILGVLGDPIKFMPLWHHIHRVGVENADGEFSWIDFNNNLSELEEFYQSNQNDFFIGSAYPGFHDFYEQGGWGNSYGFIDHQDGVTLSATLNKANEYQIPYLQLVTWNDFGEGTVFEPTQEFEFQYLEMVQDFAGVDYNYEVLEVIFTYYLKRKEYAGNNEVQEILDNVFEELNQLEVAKAESLLAGI